MKARMHLGLSWFAWRCASIVRKRASHAPHHDDLQTKRL